MARYSTDTVMGVEEIRLKQSNNVEPMPVAVVDRCAIDVGHGIERMVNHSDWNEAELTS